MSCVGMLGFPALQLKETGTRAQPASIPDIGDDPTLRQRARRGCQVQDSPHHYKVLCTGAAITDELSCLYLLGRVKLQTS